MNQARRSEFDLFTDPLFVRPQRGRVGIATGSEAPVASPALELQRALDAMFTSMPVQRLDYGRGVAMTAGALVTIAACGFFWWEALRWAAALVGQTG